MRQIVVSEDIFPIGEFKKHASSLMRRVHDAGHHIVVTQNGKPVGVVVPPDEYDKMTEFVRLRAAVAEGLEAAKEGRFVTQEEAKNQLEKLFGPLDDEDPLDAACPDEP